MSVHMPGTHGGKKRVWDLLELEKSAAVSHHVGAGNGTEVLHKNKYT